VRSLSIVLIHHPVRGRDGEVVTSAITNLDIHDLARSASTYGCARYYITHPIAAQRDLVLKIREHWLFGSSGKRIPDRAEALRVLEVRNSLDDIVTELGGRSEVEIWATAARSSGLPLATFAEGRARLAGEGKPILLLFGTSWGLHEDTLRAADLLLEPISGPTTFNHLSVRSACAIILDRLTRADG